MFGRSNRRVGRLVLVSCVAAPLALLIAESFPNYLQHPQDTPHSDSASHDCEPYTLVRGKSIYHAASMSCCIQIGSLGLGLRGVILDQPLIALQHCPYVPNRIPVDEEGPVKRIDLASSTYKGYHSIRV